MNPRRWLGYPQAAHVHAALALLLIAWAAFQCFGPVRSQGIAAATFDLMQRHRLWASAPDPRLLIVDVDERSLADLSAEFGRWPWSRDTLATVLQHAQAEGAAAVVFDILFSDPDRLRPGGDRALDTAVRAGTLGFFEAVRLPARNDALSELTLDRVPGLGIAPASAAASSPASVLTSATATATVPSPVPAPAAPRIALILPFMQAMLDAARIGTNTVELDADGKLRRFAWAEPLQGWRVVSIPLAVARALGVPVETSGAPRLVVWREHADAYPRVSFSRVLACAEQRTRALGCVSLAGKIVVIGVTASSLHDIMSSPLGANHPGVDILATLIDNALHQRWYREIDAGWRFALALAALAVAWRATRWRAASATQVALIVLPICLVTLGYASLHTEWLYLDLMLPAGVALSFLSLVKLHDTVRRHGFGLRAVPAAGRHALATGSAARCAEQLERQVFDLAGRHGLVVSGGVNTAGIWGDGDSCWVLWNLDAADAAAFAVALRAAIPGAWALPFVVSSEPQHDLHRALGARLAIDATAETNSASAAPATPQDKHHAPV